MAKSSQLRRHGGRQSSGRNQARKLQRLSNGLETLRVTSITSLLVVEGENQEHNPEALRLFLHNGIKRQLGQHLHKNQDRRPEKCLSLY